MLHPTHPFFYIDFDNLPNEYPLSYSTLLTFGHGNYKEGFILKPNIGHPYILYITQNKGDWTAIEFNF